MPSSPPTCRLNRFARVETTRGPSGEIEGLRIVAPVKGRGRRVTTIRKTDDPHRFAAVRRAVLTALFDAQTGRDALAEPSEADRDLLRQTGLLVTDDETPHAVAFQGDIPGALPSRAEIVDARASLSAHGFCVIRGIASGDLLGDLQRYYRALVAEGFATYGGEGGESYRWVAHNDPAAERLHGYVGAVVRAVTDATLKPSFTYLLQYLEGASLEPHRDREQCAVTAVLQVDFDPAPSGATPWPLYFRMADGPRPVFLALGDLVVFHGTAVEHYREPLACGRSSTNLAFCFVPDTFAGSLD